MTEDNVEQSDKKISLTERLKELNKKPSKIGWLIFWNLPLLIVYPGYFMAIGKLEFLGAARQYDMAPMPLSPEKFESAVKLTLWLHNNLWIFLVYAIIINLCYFGIPKKNKLKILRAIVCVLLYIPSFLIYPYTFHLTMSLMTNM